MKALVIRANGMAEYVEFPKKGEDKLRWYYETLGIGCIDIVRPHGLEEVAETYGLKSLLGKFSLVVDDEALLKEKPQLNVIASLLYGVDKHGQPLFGDVMVVKDEVTEEGIDSVGMSDGEAMLLQTSINSLIDMHNMKIKEDKDE